MNALVTEYLERFGIYSREELDRLSRRIQDVHLKGLPPGNSCLITDCEEIIINRKTGKKRVRGLLFAPLPGQYKRIRQWEWHFDSAGRYHKDSFTTMKVKAIEL